MGMKMFCDHCGNTITSPNRFRFGPVRCNDDDDDEGWRTRRKAKAKPFTATTIKIVEIDLCNACAPIWMTRVQNLTAESDPEEN
jgi:hypothetical protein